MFFLLRGEVGEERESTYSLWSISSLGKGKRGSVSQSRVYSVPSVVALEIIWLKKKGRRNLSDIFAKSEQGTAETCINQYINHIKLSWQWSPKQVISLLLNLLQQTNSGSWKSNDQRGKVMHEIDFTERFLSLMAQK